MADKSYELQTTLESGIIFYQINEENCGKKQKGRAYFNNPVQIQAIALYMICSYMFWIHPIHPYVKYRPLKGRTLGNLNFSISNLKINRKVCSKNKYKNRLQAGLLVLRLSMQRGFLFKIQVRDVIEAETLYPNTEQGRYKYEQRLNFTLSARVGKQITNLSQQQHQTKRK